MNKRTFYVYECKAIRKDKSILYRKIAIQAHFQIEDLLIANLSLLDEVYKINNIVVRYDDVVEEIDSGFNRIANYGGQFFDLSKSTIKFDISYEDGSNLKFVCKKVEEKVEEKTITRKTPLLLEASNYCHLSFDEYYDLIPNDYKKSYEKEHYDRTNDLDFKDMKFMLERFFSFYRETYYLGYEFY